MTPLQLTKHHGFGNDFLVATDDGAIDWFAVSRRLCDRRTGIGADGVLVVGTADADVADVRMTLYNADGSRAEMSGNGIRCFVHAVVRDRGLRPGTVRVLTDAGVRAVTWTPTDDGGIDAAVDMGAVTVIEPPDGWGELGVADGRPVSHVSLGNPHTVVGVDDVALVDLVSLGERFATVNLEIVEPGPDRQDVTMRVHERGVGLTEACGTGAAATAWAAAQWGFVDPRREIVVHMPGGSARILLDQPRPGHVTLSGPATYVGSIEVDVDRVEVSP